MIILRFIYWIFKKQILKIYYSDQPKTHGFDRMEKCFVDSNGMQYFKYKEDFDTPLERVRQFERILNELKAGISDENLKTFLDEMEKCLNGGKKTEIAKIGFLVTEMKNRRDLVLHPDLMFDLVATLYIREDEEPAEINKTIHSQKIEQFKKDSREGLYDFFYRAGLSKYIPYLTKLESDWDEYWKESKIKVGAMKEFLKASTTE